MDGASAQIPVIMGTISDENPKGVYKKTGEQGKGFQPLLPPDYNHKSMVRLVDPQLVVQHLQSQNHLQVQSSS